MKYRIWTGSMMEPWEHAQAIAPAHFEKEWKVLMFTGVFDKNGREIYEGDILLGSHMYAVSGNSEVCYIDGMLCLRCGVRVRPFSTTEETRAGWCLAGSYDYGPIEMIGNIYENPELLKS